MTEFVAQVVNADPAEAGQNFISRSSFRGFPRGQKIVEVTLKDGTRRAVVKDITGNTHLDDPEDLLRVHEFISRYHPSLAAHVPRIIGIDRRQGCIVMEYIEGPTLEAVLKSAEVTKETGKVFVEELAVLLGMMTQLKPSETGLDWTPWKNRQVLPAFEAAVRDPALAWYWPSEINTPAKFYARFDPTVFTRTSFHLGVVDCQPKNILVPPSGSPVLIDLDYSVTNPALVVAHFLVSLDRLGICWPTTAMKSKIAFWQRCFLSAYLTHADSNFPQDLPFFYATTLTRICHQHSTHRPWVAPYLRWYYGNRLNAFLNRWKETLPSHKQESVVELFGDPG